MRGASIWYEMIIFAVLLVIGSSTMITFSSEMAYPLLSQYEEKSALDTEDAIEWVNDVGIMNAPTHRYGKDLLLTLLITDEYNCYPHAIKIDNSPVLKIPADYYARKMRIIGEVYDPAGSYQLKNKVDKKIQAVLLEKENVSGQEVAFMHYYIDVTPPAQPEY